MNHYIMLNLDEVFKILDDLNTCGLCLNIKTNTIMKKLFHLLKSNNRLNCKEYVYYRYCDLIMDDLPLEDLSQENAASYEKVKNKILNIIMLLHRQLHIFKLYENELLKCDFTRRIDKRTAILKIDK